jgi:hypothetical protein
LADKRRAPKRGPASHLIALPCRAPRLTKLNRAASCAVGVGTGPLTYKPAPPPGGASSAGPTSHLCVFATSARRLLHPKLRQRFGRYGLSVGLIWNVVTDLETQLQ